MKTWIRRGLNSRRTPTSLPSVCVYRIRNTSNGRIYVGGSRNFPLRIEHHLVKLRMGRHENYKLQNDFDTCGEAAFLFEVIEPVENPDDLLGREQHHLDTLRPYYNIARYAGVHPRYGRMPNQDVEQGAGEEHLALHAVLRASAVGLALLAAWRSRRRG